MADISQITLPSGSTYYIKDAFARNKIDGLESRVDSLSGIDALAFKGVSDIPLTDGGVEEPVINGVTKTIDSLNVGDIYFYEEREYIWGPNPEYDHEDESSSQYIWHELGRLTGLGGLAYKSTATTAYTPQGTISATFSGIEFTATGSTAYRPTGSISQPTFGGTSTHLVLGGTFTPSGSVTIETMNKVLGTSVTTTNVDAGSYTPAGTISTAPIGLVNGGSTTNINSATSKSMVAGLATTAPGANNNVANEITYYSVADETLSLYKIGCNKADSINVTTVTVKNGDGTYGMSSSPTFSGTKVKITTDSFPLPTTSLTFTGSSASVSVSGDYIPEGTVTAPTFNGNAATIDVSVVGTPEGTISAIFTGTESTISVS